MDDGRPRAAALIALLAVAHGAERTIGYRIDVPWVATSSNVTAAALDWAAVGPDDVLYELGCGEGGVAVEAARRGARAVCVELDPSLAAIARQKASAAGVFVDVREDDFFQTGLADATVIFLFLLPELNSRLRAAINRAPRVRTVISHKFEMHGWACGERQWVGGESLLLRWQAPFRAEPTSAAGRSDADGAQDEFAIIDHALDCAALEEVQASVARDDNADVGAADDSEPRVSAVSIDAAGRAPGAPSR